MYTNSETASIVSERRPRWELGICGYSAIVLWSKLIDLCC